jgi:hypothetical protein
VVIAIVLILGGGLAFGVLELTQRRSGQVRPRSQLPQLTRQQRLNWRMPPLALLKPVQWSPATKLAMLLLRGYLVISVVLLVVKAVQIGK